jgi:hypothetical protein
MIEEQLKLQLETLSLRATEQAEAKRWASGDLDSVPEELLPKVPENAKAALNRLAKQVQSIGPRIVSTIKFGTIGEINWGGDNADFDAAMNSFDYEGLIDEILEQGLVSGMLAGIVRRDPDTDEPRMEPLVGYAEPVIDPRNPTQASGFIHAWINQTAGAKQERWTVRIYDFGTRTMKEWRDLTAPERAINRESNVTIEPGAEYPQGAPMPRFVMLERGPDRLPRGLIMRNLPLIQSDWSSQIRGDRAEENTAFPQLKIKGEVEDDPDERSSAHIIRLLEGGDAGFILPGDLAQIHEHHNRKLERIREDCNMPGGFLGSQTPSAEAMREAGAKYVNQCKALARRESILMTQLGQDLAEALDIGDAPPITISINRELERQNEIDQIVSLYREGLVEFGAAVRSVSVYVPTWGDKEVEAFVKGEESRVNPPPPVDGELTSDNG